MLLTIPIFLSIVLANVVISVYLERKISAFIQDRMGPMEVGKWGLLQLVADLLKLVQKEDLIPRATDKKLFLIAPILIFSAVFAGFSVMPLSPSWQGSSTQIGIFLLLAVISLDVVGILMAGWASNNKYTLLGAMRSVAQIISYEIPLGLSILAVVLTCGTLHLQEISLLQGTASPETNYLFGIKALAIETNHWGGIFTWNILRSPFLMIVFIIFFITSLAECNRSPFDLPEAESELVGGFHTEYSGFRWAIVMLSEYAMMLLLSLLGVVLFLGSWNSPLPNIGNVYLADWTNGNFWGFFWLFGKAYCLILIQMWVRWTLPRLRIDQLMYLCWKVLTPFALVLFFITIVWRLLMVN